MATKEETKKKASSSSSKSKATTSSTKKSSSGTSKTKKTTSTKKKEPELKLLTEKELKKSAKKAAKKHPIAVFIIVLAITVIIVGILFVLYKSGFFDPPTTTGLFLNGKDQITIGIGSVYEELGAKFLYKDEDKSDLITITYLYGDTEVPSIDTSIEKEYTVKYHVLYEGTEYEKARKVTVTDVAPLTISFLELGNKYTGDSIYIKAGDTDILVDAGSRKDSATAIRQYVTAEGRCEDNKLEFVFATHAHQDHIAGFVGSSANPGIFDKFEIETLIDFAQTESTSQLTKDYKAKRETLASKGTKTLTALECYKGLNGGQKTYDLAPGITLDILYQKYYEQDAKGNENEYSVCFMINQGDNHYLLTGDLEEKGEESLIQENTLPNVQLFKANHHGSYTANTTEFLNVIKPEIVAVTCVAGSDEYTKNKDNMFPSQNFINNIAPITDKIYVTSQDDGNGGYKPLNGTITFTCLKGTDYQVNCSNNNTILKESDWFKANRTWPTV